MIKTAHALVPPLLHIFYLFCQTPAFGVFMDLRNTSSEMSTVQRARCRSNCPCSVWPVGTHRPSFSSNISQTYTSKLFT